MSVAFKKGDEERQYQNLKEMVSDHATKIMDLNNDSMPVVGAIPRGGFKPGESVLIAALDPSGLYGSKSMLGYCLKEKLTLETLVPPQGYRDEIDRRRAYSRTHGIQHPLFRKWSDASLTSVGYFKKTIYCDSLAEQVADLDEDLYLMGWPNVAINRAIENLMNAV